MSVAWTSLEWNFSGNQWPSYHSSLQRQFSLLFTASSALDKFTNYNRLVFGVIPNLVEKYPDLIDDTIYADKK